MPEQPGLWNVLMFKVIGIIIYCNVRIEPGIIAIMCTWKIDFTKKIFQSIIFF